MVLKASQERVKTLLKDTITLLCKNGLEFKDNFTVEAIIGVTLDNDEVMLISMNEIVKSDGAAKVSLDDELSKDLSTSDIGNGTTKKVSETHRKRKRSRSPSSKLCPVKIEPRSPEHADNSLTNFNPKAEDLWAGGNPPSLSPSALDDATAEPSLLEQKNEHSALGGFLSNPGSIEQGAEEYDETGEGEFDNDGEDIVFIKEEALSDGTPSSYGQSSGFPQQSSSYSGDTGMTWAQQTPHSFQSRRSGPRLPHTSTATSSTSDMQNSQSDTQPNTSMQGSQQQNNLGNDVEIKMEDTSHLDLKPVITVDNSEIVHAPITDDAGQTRLSKSTVKATRWGVRILQEWLAETGRSSQFEYLETKELSDLLRQFFADIHSKKSKCNSKSALYGLRSAIHRHITSPPYSRKINILHDREFRDANDVLLSIIKSILKDGKGESIHPEDASRLCTYFNNADTPRKLQQKVFYDLMRHLGLNKGREGLRLMTKSSFKVSVSPSLGTKFVTVCCNESDKDPDSFDGVQKTRMMFEQPGEKLCPVQSFEKYVAHLNPKCPAFWQAAKTDFTANEAVMYRNTPMGVNALQNMMRNIAKDAELSKHYTNYSLRARAKDRTK